MNQDKISVKRILFFVTILVASVEFVRYFLIDYARDGSFLQPYIVPIIISIILAGGNYIVLNKLLGKYIEQEAKLKQAESLYKLGMELGSFKDARNNLELTVKHIKSLLRVDYVALALYNPNKDEIRWPYVIGNDTDKHTIIRTRKGEGLTGHCIEKRTAVHVEEYPRKIPVASPEAIPIMKIEKLVSGLCVPVTYEEQIYGVIFVAYRKAYKFNSDEVFILYGIANQLAVLLEHARLYQEIESLATVAERERLAREIHDGVAQTIGYVQLQMKKLQRHIEVDENADYKLIIDDVNEAIERSYNEVRQSINGLKDKQLFSKGFRHWLEEHTASFSRQFDIEVEIEYLDQTANDLSEIAKIQIGRIIQEALVNIRKHAEASQVKIIIGRDDANNWIIEIADNGVGFEIKESADGHYGLSIMEERAQSIGGQVRIESITGLGTKIIITLPHEENERREYSWI